MFLIHTGKNNGTVQGVSYFKCPDNHGMFVRQTQIEALKSTPKKAGAAGASDAASPTPRRTTRSATSSNASVGESHEAGGSKEDELDSQVSSRRSSFTSQPAAVAATSVPTTPAPNVPKTVTEEAANNAALTASPAISPVKLAPPPAAATQPQSITIPLRSATVSEDDPVRIRELEMLRKQVDTMQQYKQNWMEKQQQLQKTISELERHSQVEHERLESELVLKTETAELALLDKQVAEEKVGPALDWIA